MQIFIDTEDIYTMKKLNNIRERLVDYIQANEEDELEHEHEN